MNSALELDLDLRLAELFGETVGARWDLELVACFMRAAYGKGYTDALRDGGSLLTTHGYKLPPREERVAHH